MSFKKLLVFVAAFLSLQTAFAQDNDHSFYGGLGFGVGIPLAPFNSKVVDPTGGGTAKLGFSTNLILGYQLPEKAYGAVFSVGYNVNKFDINGLESQYPQNNLQGGTAGSYSIINVMLGPSISDRNDKFSYTLALQFGYASVSFPSVSYSVRDLSTGQLVSYGLNSTSNGSIGFQLSTNLRYSITDNLCALGLFNVLYAKPSCSFIETILNPPSTITTFPLPIKRYIFLMNINLGVAYTF